MKILTECDEGVVDLTMANPPIAPDYDKYRNSTLVWFAQD